MYFNRILCCAIFVLLLHFIVVNSNAQVAVSSDSATADLSAILDVQSTDKGILIPRMHTAERELISNPATGLLVFDTDAGGFWFYNGTSWKNLSADQTPSEISDVDMDTGVQVEESDDEDVIRFDVSGNEVGVMDHKTFHLAAPGNSLFIGQDAGLNDDGTNNYNTFIGKNSGKSNTIGFRNTYLGYLTGESCQGFGNNTFIGSESGRNTLSGSNTFVGSLAGRENISGEAGTFIGTSAGESNTSGSRNVYIGQSAGSNNTAGSKNTVIGHWAGANMQGSGNVLIGNEAGYYEAGNNKLYIDNSNTNSPLIYGEFDSDLLSINGTLDLNAHNITNADTVSASFFNGDGSNITNVPGDDLGDHSATQNINTDGHWISGDGSSGGIYIDENNKVGIGTSSPDARFHLLSTDPPVDSTGFIISQGQYHTLFSHVTNGHMVIGKPHVNNQLVLSTSGLVGIGAIPSRKLDVNGAIRMRSGASAGFVPVSDALGTMTWTDPAVLGDDLGSHTATQDLVMSDYSITDASHIQTSDLAVDGATLAVDPDNNRVGIGTGGPETKLHILNFDDPAILAVERIGPGGDVFANLHVAHQDASHIYSGISFSNNSTFRIGPVGNVGSLAPAASGLHLTADGSVLAKGNLTVDGNVFANGSMHITDTLYVDTEIAMGSEHLQPVGADKRVVQAFGFVFENGDLTDLSYTSEYIDYVEKDGTGEYNIYLTATAPLESPIALITPSAYLNTHKFYAVTDLVSEGVVKVRMFNSAGNAADCGFSFMIIGGY